MPQENKKDSDKTQSSEGLEPKDSRFNKPDSIQTKVQADPVQPLPKPADLTSAASSAAAEAAGVETLDLSEAQTPDPPDLPDFSNMLAEAAAGSIEMLNDVELNVKVELGRTELTVEEVLRLSEGSVVELDKLAGDPVDILVNEQLIARGEILVVNDNFCVRINEIIPGVSERAK